MAPSSPSARRTAAALLLVAVLAPLAGTARGEALPGADDASGHRAAAVRTWVVDAVDDARGNRFVAADTGTSTVRVGVGDTVEWQFDQALIDHDLTSAPDSPTPWPVPVAEFRSPGGAPFRYTFDTPGTYTYLCTVHGTLMRGTVVVEGSGTSNRPPTADPVVGPTTGTAPLTVEVSARAADPDGDPLGYAWDFGTGQEADRSVYEDARFIYADPGFYTLSLEVFDGRGGVLRREYPITVGDGSGTPVVDAAAHPASGPAPHAVAFAGRAYDAQGGPLTYSWDFGDAGRTDDTASTPDAPWTYEAPGRFTATLTVTDAEGRAGTDTVEVEVSGGPTPLPEVTAAASPAGGAAPLRVAFSTEVRTDGEVAAYADGLRTHPDLAGTASVVRRRGQTVATLEVSGLAPEAAHQAHVHERACADERGGAPFRFDESRPFGEDNELWLHFTSDSAGGSGPVAGVRPLRAGPDAVSVVVLDPHDPARRIGCADLAPTTADLTYRWDFGDGATGAGPDPDHVYATPGRYTAQVVVSTGHAGGSHDQGHHGTATVTDTVEVVVREAADTTAPQTRITAGPRGTVATDRAVVGLAGNEAGSRFACRLDDRPWSPCPATATWTRLSDGPHTVRARATDAAGNTDPTPAVLSWTVDTAGPVVRLVGPRATSDRTPTVRARVVDRHSGLRPRSFVLRLDGRRVRGVRIDHGRLAWTPAQGLAPGRHVVRLQAVDSVGNLGVRRWRLVVRR